MVMDTYGGKWTERKLTSLRKYLSAYRTIFTRNPKAKYWHSYRDGSTAIALGLASPFDRYLFIEKSKKRIQALKELVETTYPAIADRCTFDLADANASLKQWSEQRNWKKERAVVFLDPFGMQVDWETVDTLAKTGGVDLWYLFLSASV